MFSFQRPQPHFPHPPIPANSFESHSGHAAQIVCRSLNCSGDRVGNPAAVHSAVALAAEIIAWIPISEFILSNRRTSRNRSAVPKDNLFSAAAVSRQRKANPATYSYASHPILRAAANQSHLPQAPVSPRNRDTASVPDHKAMVYPESRKCLAKMMMEDLIAASK